MALYSLCPRRERQREITHRDRGEVRQYTDRIILHLGVFTNQLSFILAFVSYFHKLVVVTTGGFEFPVLDYNTVSRPHWLCFGLWLISIKNSMDCWSLVRALNQNYCFQFIFIYIFFTFSIICRDLMKVWMGLWGGCRSQMCSQYLQVLRHFSSGVNTSFRGDQSLLGFFFYIFLKNN